MLFQSKLKISDKCKSGTAEPDKLAYYITEFQTDSSQQGQTGCNISTKTEYYYYYYYLLLHHGLILQTAT